MKPISCKIGFHTWDYSQAQYDSEIDEELGISAVQGFRICEKCGKLQIEDRHCLGLNPPQYVTSYSNLRRIR